MIFVCLPRDKLYYPFAVLDKEVKVVTQIQNVEIQNN